MTLFRFFSLILAYLLSANVVVNAQFQRNNHTELNWKTIETEHFSVTYHQGLETSAGRVAKIAEEIYHPVTALYNYEPQNPIHFIIQDTDDISNGAAYFYDNKIVIWALPMDYDLRGTHNWLRDVVTHEFTHIVSMQAAMRFNRHIPALYFQWFRYENERRDDVVRGFPNGIVSYPYAGLTVPLWFAEGAAQYNSGTLKYDHWDSHRDMLLRERSLNGSLLNLDDMAVFGKVGIGNESVYNQGYSFITYIADRFGEQSISKIAKAFSSTLPISISGAIKKATGIEGEIVFEDWKRKIGIDYTGNTNIIQQNLAEGTVISKGGAANLFPTWSQDGNKIAYLSSKNHISFGRTDLMLFNAENGNSEKIASSVGTSPSWSPDGNELVYGRVSKPDKHGSTYFDLYRYDIKKKKEKRLTHGSRGRYPAFSPDGKEIVFVTTNDGASSLMVYDIKTETIRELLSFEEIRQAYKLDWSPDGNSILFETSTENGRDIALVNADGSEFRMLLNSPADERHPVFSSDGEKIYYSSDKTGIFNIYSYDLTNSETKQWTNVTGGAFMPSVSSKGELSYSRFEGTEYKLSLLKLGNEVKPEHSVYNNYLETLPTVDYDQNSLPEYESKDYVATTMTTFFMPRLMIDYGTVKVGGYVFSNELLNKISVIGGATINKDYDYDLYLRFDFNRLSPNIFIEAYGISQNVVDSLVLPGQTTPLDIKFNLKEVSPGMTFYRGVKDQFTFRLTYSIYSASQSGFLIDDFGGLVKTSFGYDYFIGRSASVECGRDNSERTAKSYIVRDNGMRWRLSYAYKRDKFIVDFARNEDFGTIEEVFIPFNYQQLDLNIDKYFSLPGNSALALNIEGGYISNNVNDFLHYFGGGLLGMKGYSYYSYGGERKILGTVTLNAPISNGINKALLNLYIRDLYGGIFFQYGDAWIGTARINEFKRTVGYSIRVGAYSFYAFPTAFEFQAAYGLDKFSDEQGIVRGKEWRYYFTRLFDFL